MNTLDHQLERHEVVSKLERPPEFFKISHGRAFVRHLVGGYHSEIEVVEEIVLKELDALRAARPGEMYRLLDLGCGRGKTLLSLKKHFDVSIGTDFSPTFCALARNNLAKDIKERRCFVIQNNVLDSLPFADSVFDTVTMTAVLEHIEDVYTVMKEANRVLHHGGLIVLSVPNVAVLNRRLAFVRGHLPTTCTPRWRWPDEGWDGDHVSYFTQEALKMLFVQTGFKMNGCRGSGYASRLRSLWPSLLSADLICYGFCEK